MSRSGWIKVYRSHLENDFPLWGEKRPRTRFEAYLDLVAMASFSDQTRRTEYGLIHQRRGEIVISIRVLARRWHWTVRRTRTFLAAVTRQGLVVALEETQAGTRYSIVNYGDDDATDTPTDPTSDTGSSTDSGPMTDTGPAQQRHKREELIKNSVRIQSRNPEKGENGDGPSAAGGSGDWVDQVVGLWRANHGEVSPEVVERDLGPAVVHYGATAMILASRAFVTFAQDSGEKPAFITPKVLASQAVHWIEQGRTYFGDQPDQPTPDPVAGRRAQELGSVAAPDPFVKAARELEARYARELKAVPQDRAEPAPEPATPGPRWQEVLAGLEHTAGHKRLKVLP